MCDSIESGINITDKRKSEEKTLDKHSVVLSDPRITESTLTQSPVVSFPTNSQRSSDNFEVENKSIISNNDSMIRWKNALASDSSSTTSASASSSQQFHYSRRVTENKKITFGRSISLSSSTITSATAGASFAPGLSLTSRRGKKPLILQPLDESRRLRFIPDFYPLNVFDVDDGSPNRNFLDASPSSGVVLQSMPSRRESFLYRSDSEFETSPKSASRHSSIGSGESHCEDFIVTPFAQILASLRNVRNNYVHIANVPCPPNRTKESTRRPSYTSLQQLLQQSSKQPITDEAINKLAMDTLEELDWCLDQLETIQVHRSVGDMATTKFKRMLKRELSQNFSENHSQISEWVARTFTENKSDMELPFLKFDEISVDPPHQQQTQSGHYVVTAKNVITGPNLNSPNRSHPTSLVTGHTKSSQIMSHIPGVKPPVTHADSLIKLPKYGVETNQEEELGRIFDDIDKWGLNMFKVSEYSNKHPLTAALYTIFKSRDLFHTFKISARKFVNFVTTLESHYLNVPYHNSIHAADVAQSVHVLLLSPALDSVFTDLEIMTALFSAAIHDVDHPGVTNQYLINCSSELALMYNDESVLEHHSLAVAFKVLSQEDYDIFDSLSGKQRKTLRKIAIDMVLATDMSKHMSLLADLKTMVETKKVAGSGVLLLDNYTERIQVLQNMLHCADLGNPTKPLDIYKRWCDSVMEEFFQQGDKERALGLEISPMCDRYNATIERSQVGFIEYIVHPLWETWAELVYPDAQEMLDAIEDNRIWYHSMSSASPPAGQEAQQTDAETPTKNLTAVAERIKFQVTLEEPEDEDELEIMAQ